MSTVICLPFNHLNKTVFVRSVFNEVHENSTEVWKWEMYRLVEECDARPSLAPPLSVLEDFFELLKGIWKRTCRRKKEDLYSLMGSALETLRLFERDCMNAFLDGEEKKHNDSIDQRIRSLEEKTEQLLELYEAAPDDDNNWGDIVELADNLGKILDHSDSNDSEDEKDKKKEKKKAGKQGGNAVRAKTARLQSAIIARHNEKLQSEISTVKQQLNAIEERRLEDVERTERKNTEAQKKLEQILNRALGDDRSTRSLKSDSSSYESKGRKRDRRH